MGSGGVEQLQILDHDSYILCDMTSICIGIFK